jgi:hypothetical protein
MLTSMPVQHLDAMVTHELIHIKHSDYLINLFISIVEILLFFNPIVWWLSGVIRAEMEHRCDDRAVLVTGNKLNYAYALVATQENQYFHDSQLALSMAKNRGHLTARINRLFDLKNNKSIAYGKPLISLIVLLSSVLLLAFSSAEEVEMNFPEEQNFSNEQDHLQPETFYYFNNEIIDKDTFYQVSKESVGASHGLVLEARMEFRFFTDMQMYDTWKDKTNQDKSTKDKPILESVLLVDGEERPMEFLEKLNEEKNIGWIGVNTGTHAEAISEKYKGKSVMVVKTKRGSSSNLIEKEIIEGVIGDSIKYKYYPKTRILKTADRSYKVKTTVVPEGENWKDMLKLEVDTYERQKINNFGDSSKPIMSKYYALVAQSMAKRQKANFGYSPRIGFGYSLTKSIQDTTELSPAYGIKEKPGLTLINKIPHGVNQNGYSAFDTIKAIGFKSTSGARIALSTPPTKSIDQDSIPPLIIVDGLKVKSITNLDPNQIESISVLKGESAIEVYGEEGQDGVFLITTKKGTKTKRINDTEHINDTRLHVEHKVVKRGDRFYLQGKVTGNVTKQNVTDAFIRFDDNWKDTFHTDKNGEFEIVIPSGAKEAVIRHFMLPSAYVSVDVQKIESKVLKSRLENSLKVSSNPATDIVTIQLDNNEDQMVGIYIMIPDTKEVIKKLHKTGLKNGAHEFLWNSKKAMPGMYLVWVQTPVERFNKNLLIE